MILSSEAFTDSDDDYDNAYYVPACGGMDNMCTVYDVNNRDSTGAAKMVRELAGYEGFLSSCRFLDDTHILTGSGDMKM